MTLDALTAGDTGVKRLVHQQVEVRPFHVPGERRDVVDLRGDAATRTVSKLLSEE